MWAVGGFIKTFFFERGIAFTPLVFHGVATAGTAGADIGFSFGSSGTSGVDSATASVWIAGELVNARNIRA